MFEFIFVLSVVLAGDSVGYTSSIKVDDAVSCNQMIDRTMHEIYPHMVDLGFDALEMTCVVHVARPI